MEVVCRMKVREPGLTPATMAPTRTTRKMKARTHTRSWSAIGAGWRRAMTGPAGRRATAPDGARWIGSSAVTIADSGCATADAVRVGAEEARTNLVAIGSASSEYSDVVSCESVIVGSSSSRRCQQSATRQRRDSRNHSFQSLRQLRRGAEPRHCLLLGSVEQPRKPWLDLGGVPGVPGVPARR
jgi:hypothetical protein